MEELVFMKMYLFKWHIIVFLLFFHANHCQRRISEGEAVTQEKKYVVYLLKASSISPQNYENWLCGGALVTKDYIVTSAACVTDVIHLYAIAGYNKYVPDSDIFTDPCTKEKKKKIVFSCTPKDYNLEYHKPEKWTYIDIAMVRVESPYDFEDDTYATVCSYTPAAIPINYESKYQEAGIDAIVLGWGHTTNYRADMDLDNYNQDSLYYAPVLIEKKEECKTEYAVYEGMDKVIDQYMICTAQKGNLNDEGATILKSPPTAQGCVLRKSLHSNLPKCEKIGAAGKHAVAVENTRKNTKPTNQTTNEAEQKFNNLNNTRRFNTRRAGICQNDHGGPLVTWIGSHEVLIGVASAFKVSETLECIGPYLYTSTQCNGAFLDCILKTDPSKTDRLRRTICKNLINETGYQILETYISWKDHPDGPADNERNITTHASVTNTTNNVTFNLINSKEEGNKTHQVQNTTILLNNTNGTTPIFTTESSTFTKTTKTVNVGGSTPIDLTNMNSPNSTDSATVMSTSDTTVALENDTLNNKTDIDKPTSYSTNNYRTTASKNFILKDIGGTLTTVLMRSETNVSSTTATNIRNTTTAQPGKTITKKVNVTTTVDVRTTKTTHVLLRSTTANTGDLEPAKPTRTTILGIN